MLGGTADEARRAKLVALVPQSPALLPWRTVQANARLLTEVNQRGDGQPALPDDQIDALLDEVGLAEFADAYPHELSGGMQQRVALVRAFALGAPLLLMDEPFAALDEILRAEMRYLLLRLWQEHRTTVVFVTHSIAEAVLLSDRVVVMAPRPGRVAAIDTVALDRPRTPDVEDTHAFTDHVSTAAPPARRRPSLTCAGSVRAVAPLVGMVVFFGLWELLLRAFDVQKFVMPTPTQIVRTIADDPGFFWREGLDDRAGGAHRLTFAFVAALLVAVPMRPQPLARAGRAAQWPC